MHRYCACSLGWRVDVAERRQLQFLLFCRERPLRVLHGFVEDGGKRAGVRRERAYIEDLFDARPGVVVDLYVGL